MRIKVTRDCAINGERFAEGAFVDVEPNTALKLIERCFAVDADEDLEMPGDDKAALIEQREEG